MIGPKQFDIGHKVKPRREFDNPIVNQIFEPKFKYREDELKGLVESFMDKFKSPLFEFEEKEIKPLSKAIDIPIDKNEGKFTSIAGSFLDRFNVAKTIAPKIKKKEVEEDKEEKSDISEDMINKITYKVFHNIREYLNLNNDNAPSRNKSIKIEIDF